MSVAGGDAVAVIDHHAVAVAGVRRGPDHQTIGSRLNGSAELDGDVEAFVNLTAFTAKRIPAHSESVGDVPVHRESGRNRSQSQEVRSQSIADLTDAVL